MSEVPSNNWPINRAALNWLQAAEEFPDSEVSYLAQLASWGLERGGAEVPRSQSPSQPERSNLQSAVDALVGARADKASQWFVSNPNLTREEQTRNLLQQLHRARSPQEAAQILVETAYDLMVAESATSPA